MNTEDNEQVTQKAKNLKNSKNFKKVGVSTDKTLKEIEADKKLLTELRTRRDKGEFVIIRNGQIVTREQLPKPDDKDQKEESNNTASH
ncbi:hypothetical protein ACOMHN_045667 [Nucella lapillus]